MGEIIKELLCEPWFSSKFPRSPVLTPSLEAAQALIGGTQGCSGKQPKSSGASKHSLAMAAMAAMAANSKPFCPQHHARRKFGL